MSRQSVALLGVAAVYAAMLGRMGWIDWLQVLGAASLVVGGILALLAGAAFFIALPVFLLWAVVCAIVELISPSKLKPPAPASAG